MSNQMLLATGALFILTLLILLFYQSSRQQTSVSVENEAILASSGIAQSVIAEIQKRSYDENTVTKYADSIDSLTITSSLGPDSAEHFITQYDDVDDFDNYSIVDSSTRLGGYSISVSVDYVGIMNQNNVSFARSFCKRIEVAIVSLYLPDTLKFYHIKGY
jgi:hypothetical protein